MRLKYQFQIQEVAGKYCAVVDSEDSSFNGIISMNQICKSVFEMLKEEVTEEEIVEELLKNYEESEKDISEGVRSFLQGLKDNKLLDEG